MGEPLPVVAFTISAEALRHIEWIRTQYAEAFPNDPPAMAAVCMGGATTDAGEIGPLALVVAFWRRSEFIPEAQAHVQRASGLDLIMTVPQPYRARFAGRELHFTEDEGLVLRDPPGASGA